MTGERAAADRPRRAVLALRAVRGRQAMEAVPLHDARESLAFARRRHVDQLARLESLRGDLLAEGVLRRVVGAQLNEIPAGGNSGLREDSPHWLCHPSRGNLPGPPLG